MPIDEALLKRIAALEPDGKETPLSRLCWEIANELLSLRWTLITPENPPKAEYDEVGKWTPSGYFQTKQISTDWRIEALMQEGSWTHRRPLNAPAQEPKP